MTDLSGRVALVTGGNSGIGLGMARGLAPAGADIAIWGTNPTKNDAASAQLAEWRRVMAVNLDGAFFTVRAAARPLVEQGDGGAIVLVASTSTIHGAPNQPHYAASKTALLGLTRALAVGLARHGIRVNALSPGWTDTDLLAPGKANERFVHNTVTRTPVRRWADPSEFAAVAVYLADPSLTFHTGDTLVVDGGYTIFWVSSSGACGALRRAWIRCACGALTCGSGPGRAAPARAGGSGGSLRPPHPPPGPPLRRDAARRGGGGVGAEAFVPEPPPAKDRLRRVLRRGEPAAGRPHPSSTELAAGERASKPTCRRRRRGGRR